MEANNKYEGIEIESEKWSVEIAINNLIDDFYTIASKRRTKKRLKKMFEIFIKQLENEK